MGSLRATVDYGIDLGTTNSAIARQTGATTEIFNGAGGVLVPSVVHVGAAGTIEVGRPAVALRGQDPANVSSEFKRLMGTAESIFFASIGRSFSPVELSAEVLKTLLGRAEEQGGARPQAAVVTIPAMFQLPQCEATQQAAALAGLRYAPLLQEPIAAAIASIGSADLKDGYWLVYDFGGGTFDVSLVRSRGGRLQVLDHDGDNHLGGKDFDRLVTRRAAEEIHRSQTLPGFNRGAAEFQEAFERLRVEAERVRIRLSQSESERFHVGDLAQDADGRQVAVDFMLDRGELEELIRPSILRTVAVCRKMLERNQLTSSRLKRLVLVGGPTLTPCLSRIVEAELGVEARHTVDPVTAVAIGAAIFASTQKLPAELRGGSRGQARFLDLSYESMTVDPRPVVAGQIRGGLAPGAWTLRIVAASGAVESSEVRADSTFSCRVSLTPNTLNVFDLKVEHDGHEVPELSGSFSILHGTTVAKPLLSQSIGVALADNSVRWYLRKGTILPARQRVSHTTTVSLRRGQPGTAVMVPLVQGESDLADRNTTIGVIEIKADSLPQDLPAGSEVVVTLIVDEHLNTHAEAFVPLLAMTFDRIVRFGLETRSSEAIQQDVEAQRARLMELEKMAAELENSEDPGADSRVKAIQQLLTEGSVDDRNQADQLLKGLTSMIDTWSVKDREKQLREKFAASDEQILALLTKDDVERWKTYRVLSSEFQAAIARADLQLAEARYQAFEALEYELLQEQPSWWTGLFEYLCGQLQSGPQAAEAKLKIEDGKSAIKRNDFAGLRRACIQLIGLLPARSKQALPSVLLSHLS